MPRDGWDALTVKDETKEKVRALKGEIVDLGGHPKQIKTDDEIVNAAAECLKAHLHPVQTRPRRRG